MKRSTVLWIVALLLGLSFDLLFWKHAVGINFTIYALLCLVGGVIVLGLNRSKLSWRSLLLLLPVLFFAVMAFIRREPLGMFLAIAGTLAFMALLAVTWLGGRWPWFSLADHAAGYFNLGISMLARLLIFLNDRKKEAALTKSPSNIGGKPGWKRFWAILRGVVIAVPILVIFISLLTSADLVFARQVRSFLDFFRLEKLPEYILRLVFILAAGWALAGTFLHAALRSRNENLVGSDKPLVHPFLGFTEAVVVLGAVVLLFALFAMVQFQYFFGGQTNIGVEGYTYAEYARRGFGELVGVAFFSLLLFLVLSAVVKRESRTQRWVFSALGIGMVLLVGVMLYSAFQRLLIYEGAYGFSRLRTYTHLFMLWLAGLLVSVVVLDILRRERHFALAALLAVLGFSVTLLVVNVDGFIVHRNVSRLASGGSLDAAYLASLSEDSVPAMVDEFTTASNPPAAREAVGAALACRVWVHGGHGDSNWRAFNLSTWTADRALAQVVTQLEGYQVLEDETPIAVLTPGGERYDCFGSGMD